MGGVSVPDVRSWIDRFAELVHAERDRLTELDAAVGDADHGSNLDRGMKAAAAAAGELGDAAPGELLKKVGMTLVSTVGGASGPLYGTLFLRMGASLGEATDVDGPAFAAALRAGLVGVAARGKAEVGDKTLLDALTPAVDELDAVLAEGASLSEALGRASTAADAGRDATEPLVARKGRASYLGERSAGHQDPGATSVALLVAAAAQTL
ncbi:dihydroxyacetone kinase subunit DhaL [Nocardioides mangrovicus]|uniref:dihydroxyacetone kinase subunit DhaL n=1 Tax=Nocardioides mangrovicus TaxID=2478913 RepID=UPI0038CD2379